MTLRCVIVALIAAMNALWTFDVLHLLKAPRIFVNRICHKIFIWFFGGYYAARSNPGCFYFRPNDSARFTHPL